MFRYLALLLAVSLVAVSRGEQRVYLDFDSRTSGGDHFYSSSQRDAILARMEEDFAAFDFAFSHASTPAAPYSTIYLNDGPELGEAENVDFRNLDPSDTATVNVSDAATTSAQFITLTANVASHELGHLVGLRHRDSFGPIGAGIDPDTFPADWAEPEYPGPRSASETRYHLMESDDFFIEDEVDLFFSERSAVRLAFNERGAVVTETAGPKGSLAAAQSIEMAPLATPNTLASGLNAGLVFDVDALAVTGRLGVTGEADYYRFDGLAGDLMNFEVVSETTSRITDYIDPQITLLDAAGLAVDYYGEDAFNDDEFEGYDSVLIDVTLPTDGTYYLRIEAYDGPDAIASERRGDYELFLYRFAGVEPPLAGDYNGDGLIDAADYTVWRDAYEGAGGELTADGDGSGTIDLADHGVWAANFGAAATPLTAAPEPGPLLLLAAASFVMVGVRR